MATHSSILAWKIPWIEEPGGLLSMRSQSWTRPARMNRQLLSHEDTAETVFRGLFGHAQHHRVNRFLKLICLCRVLVVAVAHRIFLVSCGSFHCGAHLSNCDVRVQ